MLFPTQTYRPSGRQTMLSQSRIEAIEDNKADYSRRLENETQKSSSNWRHFKGQSVPN